MRARPAAFGGWSEVASLSLSSGCYPVPELISCSSSPPGRTSEVGAWSALLLPHLRLTVARRVNAVQDVPNRSETRTDFRISDSQSRAEESRSRCSRGTPRCAPLVALLAARLRSKARTSTVDRSRTGRKQISSGCQAPLSYVDRRRDSGPGQPRSAALRVAAPLDVGSLYPPRTAATAARP